MTAMKSVTKSITVISPGKFILQLFFIFSVFHLYKLSIKIQTILTHAILCIQRNTAYGLREIVNE